jgi:hypothetical protein
MRQPRTWSGWFIHLLVAVSVAGAGGCLGFCHPVQPLPQDGEPLCKSLPRCCREHVYVFLINGLDPVNYGNLTGLRDYIQGLGITRVYYGQAFHAWSFEKEICRIHREDAHARFVLIGFSVGVNLADAMARAVEKEGVCIDLLVYLSGNHPVQSMPTDKPANVNRVVNLLADGLMGAHGERPYAENIRLTETFHFGAPTHPVTLLTIAEELTALAQCVHVAEPVAKPVPPPPEEAPPPRPWRNQPPRQGAPKQPPAKKDEWDFLKPVARLGKPPTFDGHSTVVLSPPDGK